MPDLVVWKVINGSTIPEPMNPKPAYLLYSTQQTGTQQPDLFPVAELGCQKASIGEDREE